jgi:putative nucleotidyltransferase with HDIG domain
METCDDDLFSMIPTRKEAWELVCEYTEGESLRRHMLSVEVAMRAYAERFGENADLWGVVGLLHDFDYERYPDVSANGHPNRGAAILRQKGVDEIVVRAILAHAPAITGAEPQNSMEKALAAVDELTGFLIAVALVRPSRSILDVEMKSVPRMVGDGRSLAPGAGSALGLCSQPRKYLQIGSNGFVRWCAGWHSHPGPVALQFGSFAAFWGCHANLHAVVATMGSTGAPAGTADFRFDHLIGRV